jgi:hypothetical protein
MRESLRGEERKHVKESVWFNPINEYPIDCLAKSLHTRR